MFDQAHMTSLFENATEGIILTNHEGQIMMANPAAEKIFGYKRDELIGQPIEILVPGQTRPYHNQLRKGFYAHPSNRVMGQGRDLHGRKKEGADIPVEVSLSHYQRDGHLFVIAFIVDITERKKNEQRLILQKNELESVSAKIRELNAELEAKVEERTLILKEALQKLEQSQQELSEALEKEKQLNEIKSRFVSMASHEFRTPLTTVLSSASLLSKYKNTADQEKRDKHIGKIKKSVNHLNDILEDFLSLGKLSEGKIEANFEKVELQVLLQDVAEEMKMQLKEGQYFRLDCQDTGAIVTDKKLIRNILINLISNAVKFSEKGPVELSIKINDAMAAITVKDSGIGISAADQEHLFSSFFRGSNAVNIEGTGLGLHIVKNYIDILGGTVEMRSELNKGTAITFNIPVNQKK